MKIKSHTNAIILLGFTLILVIMAVLTAICLTNITANKAHISEIVKDQKKTELIFDMREAANQRALSLYRMSVLEDPFEQDEEYLNFREQGTNFIKARLALVEAGERKEARAAWLETLPLIQQGTKNQFAVTDRIAEEDIAGAHDLLANSVIPNQNVVLGHLTHMLNLEKEHVAFELEQINVTSDRVYFQVSLLGSAALLVGAVIAFFVVRTTTRSERALIQAQQDSQEANQHKSLFLANMSHELRTPLNAIIGYSEMLQEEAAELGEEEFTDDLNKIHSSGQHLLSLINDILDVSKIEAGKMELYCEDFNLSMLIEEISSTIQPLFAKNNNHLQTTISDFNIEMHTDTTKLRQTLLNLLSNASKFTAQGNVCLNISTFSKHNEPWIKIDVKDSGIGMEKEHMKHLFAPFTQADSSTTRNFGGTGLGLNISKHFCEMMGGTISAISEPLAGSIFSISIPTKITPAQAKNLQANQ